MHLLYSQGYSSIFIQSRGGRIHHIYDSKETRFSIQNYIGYEVDDAMKILLEQCPTEVDSNHEIHLSDSFAKISEARVKSCHKSQMSLMAKKNNQFFT